MSDSTEGGQRGDCFVTTRWTLVLAAGRKSAPESERALAELCQAYWYPLYAYVRRQGRTREDAEDLVQAFFEQFLAGNPLEGLAAERGKFRAFLLASLKHFLANEWHKARCLKRGGGAVHLSLDWQDAEDRYHLEPDTPADPERQFDREWAIALLDRVLACLEAECERDGKRELFVNAKRYLTVGSDAIPFGEAAGRLGMDEGTLRVAVHRLRRRYRELLHDEIAQTVADPACVADELDSLRAALRG